MPSMPGAMTMVASLIFLTVGLAANTVGTVVTSAAESRRPRVGPAGAAQSVAAALPCETGCTLAASHGWRGGALAASGRATGVSRRCSTYGAAMGAVVLVMVLLTAPRQLVSGGSGVSRSLDASMSAM